jgi:type VI secretion system protein ImpM
LESQHLYVTVFNLDPQASASPVHAKSRPASMSNPEKPVSGYFGKLPARGDFVTTALPPPIIKTWDRAISSALASAKTALADRWPEAWLEAPVWRFALPEPMCGPVPLLGLWMPSIDKAGRHFPLMIAATCPGATPEQMARHGTLWLDQAEDAGRAAIADDLTPEQLTARLPPAPDLIAAPDNGLPYDLQTRPGAGFWWTDGAPLVPAQGLVLGTMPDAATFRAMLDGSP